MHVGRERLPEGRAWGEDGGSQRGVAHAPLSICSAATTASTATTAARNAAGRGAPIRRIATTWTVRISAIGAMTLVTVQRDGFSVGGTVLPSFGSPRPVPRGSIPKGQPGVGLRGREGLGRWVAICLAGSPNRSASGP